jgi:hypothetical protein
MGDARQTPVTGNLTGVVRWWSQWHSASGNPLIASQFPGRGFGRFADGRAMPRANILYSTDERGGAFRRFARRPRPVRLVFPLHFMSPRLVGVNPGALSASPDALFHHSRQTRGVRLQHNSGSPRHKMTEAFRACLRLNLEPIPTPHHPLLTTARSCGGVSSAA